MVTDDDDDDAYDMITGDDDDDDDDFDNNGPWQGRGRSRGAEAAVRTIGRPRHQEYCLSSGSGYSDPVRMRRMSILKMMKRLMGLFSIHAEVFIDNNP